MSEIPTAHEPEVNFHLDTPQTRVLNLARQVLPEGGGEDTDRGYYAQVGPDTFAAIHYEPAWEEYPALITLEFAQGRAGQRAVESYAVESPNWENLRPDMPETHGHIIPNQVAMDKIDPGPKKLGISIDAQIDHLGTSVEAAEAQQRAAEQRLGEILDQLPDKTAWQPFAKSPNELSEAERQRILRIMDAFPDTQGTIDIPDASDEPPAAAA